MAWPSTANTHDTTSAHLAHLITDSHTHFPVIAMLPAHVNCARLFEDIIRTRSPNPNALLESMHLVRFEREGLDNQRVADMMASEEKAGKSAARSSFRQSQQEQLAGAMAARVGRLHKDEAVHSVLMRRKVRE
jgi:hypothetical protein